MKVVKPCFKALYYFIPLIIPMVILFIWLCRNAMIHIELYFIFFFSMGTVFLCSWLVGRVGPCLKKIFILYLGWVVALFPLAFFFSYMIHGAAIVWGDYVGMPPTGLRLWMHLLRASGYFVFLAQIIFVPWILFSVWLTQRYRKRKQ